MKSHRSGLNSSLGTVVLYTLINVVTIAHASPTTAAPANRSPSDIADENLWLEDITGQRPLAWVGEQNAVAARELEARPEFADVFKRLLTIGNSNQRIPVVEQIGAHLYNFWRDERNPKGIWRRTTLAEYRKTAPRWDSVLDLDALANLEAQNWVWEGADCLPRSEDRCMIRLSRGGSDAAVVREFDLVERDFVKDGFSLPEAKPQVAWGDHDTLLVATDLGAGSLTDSGYPRIIKRWRRGTELHRGKVVFEASASDVRTLAYRTFWPGFEREFVVRSVTPFQNEVFVSINGALQRLAVPLDANTDQYRDQLLVQLRTPWRVDGTQYPAGALLITNLDAFLKGQRRFEVLYTPGPRTALAEYAMTRDHLILRELDNLRNRVHVLWYVAGRWQRRQLPAPELGETWITALDPLTSNEFLLSNSGFLTPGNLSLGSVERPRLQRLKQLPAFFNAEGLEIQQHEAVSKDGTRIPYFQVSRVGMKLDGSHPTLMYGYGGFEITQLPDYDANIGSAWLERGGVYVLANIRGGGEFGPAWHEMATLLHKQRSYDDFIAVAESLIRRSVTSPRQLGVMGVSNGGLLAGVMLTQRPDLFGAVVARVPLLDMRRYHRLLAGASWMSEYGNPDDALGWRYISRYSPYQNIHKGAQYPRALFMTSTRDDRVHPAHARKMAARMIDQGHDVLYYENMEGGHDGAADNRQRAYMNALAYVFLFNELSKK